jgi:homoserine kinase
MSKLKKSVRVWVPATTANVGPGFDVLGIALGIHNYVDVCLSKSHQIVVLDRSGAESESGLQMVAEASEAFFSMTKVKPKGAVIRIDGSVPAARGLGSSVTVRLGVAAGLNQLCGKPLDKDGLFELVSSLEGHPDNAAPGVYGGFCVTGKGKDRHFCLQKKLPRDLKFVAAIPDYEVETKKAREVLPETIPFQDAVHNVNRTALLVAAIWDANYDTIGNFLDDRLHQPVRSKLIPQLEPCIRAARKAGAIGGWLSGSGSTIMALTHSRADAIGKAMEKEFLGTGCECRIVVTTADNRGVRYSA